MSCWNFADWLSLLQMRRGRKGRALQRRGAATLRFRRPLMQQLEVRSLLAIFVVDIPDDTIGTPGQACSTAPGDCSLRSAIITANQNSGPDTISFNIPGGGVHTIAPQSALPTITDSV